MCGRSAEPRQTEPDGNLDARGAADGLRDLVDFLKIIGGKAPAAIVSMSLLDLLARFDGIVVMEARPWSDRAHLPHLVNGGDVEQSEPAGGCGEQNVLARICLDGIGHFAR